MIHLTREPIDPTAMMAEAASNRAGAILLFLGVTREITDGQITTSLDYEGYEPMAEKKLAQIEEEASRRWPITYCSILHRLGHLEIGEASVAVAISAPHRKDAFEAAQWLIDRLKEEVPIWKKEHGVDGAAEWIHPEGQIRHE